MASRRLWICLLGGVLALACSAPTSVPTTVPALTPYATDTVAPVPTAPPPAAPNGPSPTLQVPTTTPDPTPTSSPSPTPTPTSESPGIGPGTHAVGQDIQPGLYVGLAGTGVLDSCYWARLEDVTGDLDDILANDNATGQFYLEVLPGDGYLETSCRLTPIAEWPTPDTRPTNLEPGMYLVGRDIAPGTYRGEAGQNVLDSCYWARLSGVSGEFEHLLANDNNNGQFYVKVLASDFALRTNCSLSLTHEPSPTLEVPTATPDPAPTSSPSPTPTPTPESPGIGPGTHAVGQDIQPGLYAGLAGTGVLDSCYWARLEDVTGDLDDILANDNATGQFYLEVLSGDGYLETSCRLTPIADWPTPDTRPTNLEPGMYLVGRDIAPGTYKGEAGQSVLDSCYWARLSGVSGDLEHLLANDNNNGQFYVKVLASDFALRTSCGLSFVD